MDSAIRRMTIAEEADAAARRTVETGELERNPYPKDSAEYRAWRASFERSLLVHTAPECERSA